MDIAGKRTADRSTNYDGIEFIYDKKKIIRGGDDCHHQVHDYSKPSHLKICERQASSDEQSLSGNMTSSG